MEEREKSKLCYLMAHVVLHPKRWSDCLGILDDERFKKYLTPPSEEMRRGLESFSNAMKRIRPERVNLRKLDEIAEKLLASHDAGVEETGRALSWAIFNSST